MRRILLALCAALALASTAQAQTPVPSAEHGPVPKTPTGLLTGVDVMSATVMQQGQSSFSGIGVRARLHPERMITGFEVLPIVEYWRNSSTISAFNIKTTRKDATLGVDARYAFHAGNWNPYLGAGFGIHFLSSKVDAPTFGLNDKSDSLVKGGLAALLGTTFPMTTRVDNFLELKYHHIPGYKQLKINWGLSVKL